MHRTTFFIVLFTLVLSCGGRRRGPPVSLQPGDGACLEQLLSRSREAGYAESSVDPERQAFVVAARTASTGRLLTRQKDPQRYAVQFDVQCLTETTATVSIVDADGPFEGRRKPKRELRAEFDDFVEQLNTRPRPAPEPSPVATPAARPAFSPFSLPSPLNPFPGNGASQPPSSNSASLTCCINKTGYVCPSADALDRCSGRASRCLMNGGGESCMNEFDPSGCSRDSSVNCN